MSDIYCHEDVMDFTNPFLDYKQGHCPVFTRGVLTIPVSPKTVLPEKPLTCQGYLRGESQDYPKGESQGDLSGRVSLPSFLFSSVDWFFIGVIVLKELINP